MDDVVVLDEGREEECVVDRGDEAVVLGLVRRCRDPPESVFRFLHVFSH